MSSESDDFSYVQLDREETKKLVIEHTTGKWETLKSGIYRVLALIVLALMLYGFWLLWGVYFWLDFFGALPFCWIIARKIVKIPIRWFLQIDTKAMQLNFVGVPRSWSWQGNSIAAKDNADNIINVVNKAKYSRTRRAVKSQMQAGDIDRLEFINDARTLERTIDRLEKLSGHLYYLQKNFFNEVINTVRRLQVESTARPIIELLRKTEIRLEQPSVGKRGQTDKEQVGDED